MGKSGNERARSVGKRLKRGARPQAVRALERARIHQKADSEQRVQLQLEAYHSENRSLRAELVNERNERWHTVQACLPRRPRTRQTSKGARALELLTRVCVRAAVADISTGVRRCRFQAAHCARESSGQ